MGFYLLFFFSFFFRTSARFRFAALKRLMSVGKNREMKSAEIRVRMLSLDKV